MSDHKEVDAPKALNATMKKFSRTCMECAKSFATNRKDQKFCPKSKCRNTWHNRHTKTARDAYLNRGVDAQAEMK